MPAPRKKQPPAAEVVPNSAIVPEPEQPKPREYVVTGPHPVLGHAPRTKFRAVIPPEQEARLIRRGQIKPVDAPASDDNNTQED